MNYSKLIEEVTELPNGLFTKTLEDLTFEHRKRISAFVEGRHVLRVLFGHSKSGYLARENGLFAYGINDPDIDPEEQYPIMDELGGWLPLCFSSEEVIDLMQTVLPKIDIFANCVNAISVLSARDFKGFNVFNLTPEATTLSLSSGETISVRWEESDSDPF